MAKPDNDDIPIREKEDSLAAVAIAAMLFLTAWGNAVALLIGSLAGLVLMLIFFKGRMRHGAGLAMLVGLAVAILITVALFFGWRQ